MRGDAKVVVRPFGAMPKPVARFLDLTAENMGGSPKGLKRKLGGEWSNQSIP